MRWPNGSASCSLAEVLALAVRSGRNHKAYDKTVQAESLGENEDENDAHEEARLLCVGADTCVTHDTDRQSCCQGAHADGQASGEVRIARVRGVALCIQFSVDDDRRNEAVDT